MWHSGELSLAYLTVDGATAAEHVDAAAAAGFAAAGLRILPPTHLPASDAVVGRPGRIRRLRERCARLGVRPLDAEVVSLSAATDAAGIDAIVAAAADIGFRFIQTVVEDEQPGRAADSLARLAEAAQSAGLRVALEFMAFRPLSSLDAALRLIDRSGSNNVGLLIDALHLSRSGGTPADVAAIPPGRIAMAQLCDAPLAAPAHSALAAEARGRRLYPGEGELWLDELLDVLPDGLPLSVEVPHSAHAGMPFTERAASAKSATGKFLAARSRRARSPD